MYVHLPGAWNRDLTLCAICRKLSSPAFFHSHSASSAEMRSRASTFSRIPFSVERSKLTPSVYAALAAIAPLRSSRLQLSRAAASAPWYISPMILDVAINQISADTAIVTLSGALTLGTSLMTADNKLQGLIKAGVTKIALDMSAVPYIDSAGLGAIVHAYGLAMEMQGSIRLCGISPKVESLLKMTRMDTFLPIDADAAASLAAFA
jgi:anti-anti-sigma factor